MFGGSPFGGSPFGGVVVITIVVQSDTRAGEARGELIFADDREGQASGTFLTPRPLNYQIIIKDRAGNALGQLTNYRKVTFGKRLNNYGSASFDIMVNDSKAPLFIDPRINTIEIWREIGFDKVLVWSGEQALSNGQLNASKNNWAEIFCFDWFEQLRHRYTGAERIFADIDAGTMARTMIDETNTDDATGITIGTISPTKNRDRTYSNQNIMEAIINLANIASGFDFEVTNNKVFNVSSIIGTDKTNSVRLEYGHNIKNVNIVQDFTTPINRAIVLGEPTDATTLQRIDIDDAGLQATYGLREGRLQEMDVSEVATLTDKGTAAINKYGTPLTKVDFDLVSNITPTITDFGIGDGIRLIVKDGMYNIDSEFRVFEWEMTFDKDNQESLSLTLGNFILT